MTRNFEFGLYSLFLMC